MPRKNRPNAISSISFDAPGSGALGFVLAEVTGGTLTVNFSDGSDYTYDGVPGHVYLAFEASGPSGAYFNANIRNAY